MTESQSEFNQFREDTLKPEEKLTFATICGDFNFDNMSPSELFFVFTNNSRGLIVNLFKISIFEFFFVITENILWRKVFVSMIL